MSSIFIIHFSPPELYPPLQNLIRLLEQQPLQKDVFLLTTGNNYDALNEFKAKHPKIGIIRLGKSGAGIGKIMRLFYYAIFYAGCMQQLIKHRPGTVLYYETLSALPAYLYKRFINKNANVLVHYHEYTSPGEYEQGMFLTRWFHRMEQWMYPRLTWLSHTNTCRLQLFMQDLEPIIPANTHCVPNYPPASWQHQPRHQVSKPVRFVYLGALSMQTMYTREMADWVMGQKGRVNWDIFAYKPDADARDYLNGLKSSWICLREGLDYESLPEVVSQYDVGVILYKGHIANYVFNAPNKLFEYLVAGLDVWYPKEMIGCYEYDSEEYWPKVLRLDFDNLQEYEFEPMLKRAKNFYRPVTYSSEAALLPLAKTILNDIPFTSEV